MRDKARENYRSLKDLLKGDIEPVKGIDYPEIALSDRKVLINTGHPLDIDIEHITACLEKDTAMRVGYEKGFVGVHYWHNLDENEKPGLNIIRITATKKDILLIRSLSVFAKEYPATFEAVHNILEDYINGQFDNQA